MIDSRVQPIVKYMPSYVQNSNDFLHEIDTARNIPGSCLLVTMDIRAMYKNSPNSKKTSAVKTASENYPE